MKKRQKDEAVSYNKIITDHTVTVTPTPRPHSPGPLDNETAVTESLEKKQKMEEVFNNNHHFYRCLFGSVEYVTTSMDPNMTMSSWLQRPALYVKLLKVLFSAGIANQLEIQTI